jgi:hypothetical protein
MGATWGPNVLFCMPNRTERIVVLQVACLKFQRNSLKGTKERGAGVHVDNTRVQHRGLKKKPTRATCCCCCCCICWYCICIAAFRSCK